MLSFKPEAGLTVPTHRRERVGRREIGNRRVIWKEAAFVMVKGVAGAVS